MSILEEQDWAALTWDNAQQYIDEEVEETFEYCETIYTRN